MLLGISGSLRKASVNTLLIREAGRLWQGPFEEGDIRFPLYDGDLETEEGLPAAVDRLAEQISAADAVIISTPEYNQSLSGSLKNALDWISRAEGKPWKDKPVAILSAAAGRSGGARASYALRLAMNSFRPRLVAQELMVAGAAKEFDEEGRLTSEWYGRELREILETLKVEVSRSA